LSPTPPSFKRNERTRDMSALSELQDLAKRGG
jgi:hypothetical protein